MGQDSQNGVADWLLAGDPALRWQTLRDLVGASKAEVKRERSKVAREGWGRRLLHCQDASGTWAKGLYTPKWTSTTYTLLLLRDFGLPADNPQARRACKVLLDGGHQPDGGFNFGTWAQWTRKGHTCITGMMVSLLANFGIDDDRLHGAVDQLLGLQFPDGGWNCRSRPPTTHSSVHTTIIVLEALRDYQSRQDEGSSPPFPLREGGSGGLGSGRHARKRRAVREAQRRGREFLLDHRLFRSHRTGKVIKPEFLRFAFPPRWHYDVLRGLDYFQSVRAPRDPRLADGIEVVERARRPDGRWDLHREYNGKTFFRLERLHAPSRWNTLRALRVLKWWHG